MIVGVVHIIKRCLSYQQAMEALHRQCICLSIAVEKAYQTSTSAPIKSMINMPSSSCNVGPPIVGAVERNDLDGIEAGEQLLFAAYLGLHAAGSRYDTHEGSSGKLDIDTA